MMRRERLLEIFKKNVETYLDNIAKELEDSHASLFYNFAFPLFGKASNEYYEQVYFESYLEAYTRSMINATLRDIMEEVYPYEVEWSEFNIFGIYRGYKNDEYEREYGFEFIDRERRCGYRYCNIDLDEIDNLLCKYDIDTIFQIDWEAEETVFCQYEDKRVRLISIQELFDELFCEEDDDERNNLRRLFCDESKKAVTQASSMISLMTLPGFTPLYRYKTRNNILSRLIKDIKDLEAFSVASVKYKSIENDSKKLINDYKLSDVFLNHNYEKAFVGVSRYAKSFLTSEYLFTYFNNNPLFDYTPIISGYMKSVEQILYVICNCYNNSKNLGQKFDNYSLEKYIKFIENNDDIFSKEIREGNSIIRDCLNSYKCDRNHIFHRGYYEKWESVERVRNNTIFLYVVLFGAVEPTLLSYNASTLGIVDDAYNRLFDMLDNTRPKNYIIEIDGKKEEMELVPREKAIDIDKRGIIKNSMVFRKHDYDQWNEVEVTNSHMPTAIWKNDSQGNMMQIW